MCIHLKLYLGFHLQCFGICPKPDILSKQGTYCTWQVTHNVTLDRLCLSKHILVFSGYLVQRYTLFMSLYPQGFCRPMQLCPQSELCLCNSVLNSLQIKSTTKPVYISCLIPCCSRFLAQSFALPGIPIARVATEVFCIAVFSEEVNEIMWSLLQGLTYTGLIFPLFSCPLAMVLVGQVALQRHTGGHRELPHCPGLDIPPPKSWYSAGLLRNLPLTFRELELIYVNDIVRG